MKIKNLKIRQIYCKHFWKESKKTNVYSYKLIGAELNLCKKCENKLYKEILKQCEIESEMKDIFKNKSMKGGINKNAEILGEKKRGS